MTTSDIFTIVTRGHRTTIVEAEAYIQTSPGSGDVIQAKGEAVRNPMDPRDDYVGIMLATGRALGALASKIERRANGRVKMHDDNRQRREQAENDVRCSAWTQSGDRCKRAATEGHYCAQHGALDVF